MSDPIRRHTVEMTRRFDVEPDGGKDLEVAMAAVVFARLQGAGLIPADALLATPIAPAPGFEGKTYEARLVELIGDQDGDHRLDLDLECLQQLDEVEDAQDIPRLQALLADQYHAGLSGDLLAKQDSSSGLTFTEKGVRVQAYSRGMFLAGPERQQLDDFVASLPARAGGGAAAVDEAQAQAARLAGEGLPELGAELLRRTGDALLEAGAPGEARRSFEALRAEPYAGVAVNGAQAHIDGILAQGETFDPRREVVRARGDNAVVTIDAGLQATSYAELAGRRLSQLEMQGRMSRELGRSVDPYSTADARAYFASLSDSSSTEEMRAELEDYIQSYYVHSGEGAEWSGVPIDQRPQRLDGVMSGLPRDAAGRKIIDCEGFTYLAGGLLPERFQVSYAGIPGHVTAALFDRETGQGFAVNNDRLTLFSGPLDTPRQRADAIARNIAGDYYSLLAIGSVPSATETELPDGSPRIGALAYVPGKGVVGVVDQRTLDAYAAARAEAHYVLSFSAFLAAQGE